MAIAGSRNFTDYDLFCKQMSQWIELNGRPDLMISGGAPGTDSMAERYAREHGIPILIFKADWSQGKKAGPMRNTKMINVATHLLAFPSEQGKGTQDSIRKAQQKKLHLTLCWV